MDGERSGATADSHDAATSWPPGGGELARLIRAQDWAATPLGPLTGWPQSLRSAVGLLLRSPVPIVLLWGPEGVMLYNDAYSVFAGGRHPRLLGSEVREGWPEVADFNDNVMKVGLSGGTLSYKDQELTLYRYGRPEQVFMNLDYSPVEDETGRPAGVIAVVVETTEQVLARRRDAFRLGLERRLRDLSDPGAIMIAAAGELGRQLGAARVGYGEIDAAAEFVTVERDWSDGRLGSVAGRWRMDDFGPAIMAELRAGRMVGVEDVASDPRLDGASAAALATVGTRSMLALPLFRDGRFVSMLYIHHPEPRAWEPGEVALAEETVRRTREVVERARAEARLRESEERFRLASLAVQGMVYDWNVGSGHVTRSEGLRPLLGYGPEEALPTSAWWRARLHPEDRESHARAAIRTLEDGRERYEAEYRVRHRDGRWIDVRDTGYVIHDAEGRPARVVGTTVDVTERRRAEAALRESEARLRALTDHLPVAMVYQLETSRDMTERRYTYVSGNCGTLTGVPPEEVLADPDALLSLVEPEERPRVLAEERAAARGLRLLSIEMRARRRDGRPLVVHVFSRPRERPDGRLLWDGLLFDVTDLREAERTLRTQAEELAIILDAVPAGIWITRDPAARLITGNARSHELLRVPLGENQSQSDPAAGTGHFRFLDGAGRELPPEALPVQRAARGEEVRDVEYRISFADGGHRDIFGNAMPLRDPSGRVNGAVAAFVDISGRKRWEEHQRLLVNELNHRVKNTLATVQSVATQTLRNAATPEEARRALDSRLLALSRTHDILTQESWESADLLDIVVQAVAPYRHAREDRFRLEGPSVRVAPRLALALSMALQELATNAVKYGALSNASGTVTVGWAVEASARPARLRLRWREAGGPPVRPPARRGFGSRMIEKGLAQELDGRVRIDFAPTGLVFEVEAPLTAVEGPRPGGSVARED